jgi:hypothetical protein
VGCPDHAKDATGGLLREIGEDGVLVIKDVTSVLSMNGDARSLVLAALRETTTAGGSGGSAQMAPKSSTGRAASL